MKRTSLAAWLVLVNLSAFANERAQDALTRLQQDSSVQWVEADDWRVANVGLEQWFFTREGHPAHLSGAHRRVVEENDQIGIQTKLICEHDEPTCRALLAEIELIDGEIKDAVADSSPTRTIEHPAYLLHVQTDQEWELVRSEFNVVAVRRSSEGGARSNVGSVQIYNLPEFSSDDEFLEQVVEQRRQRFADDPRTEVVDMRESVESFGQAICVRLDYHYLDLGSRMDDGSVISLPFRSLGYRCQHPSEPTLGVHMSYSLRTHDVGDGSTFNKEAALFLAGIEFQPFERD